MHDADSKAGRISLPAVRHCKAVGAVEVAAQPVPVDLHEPGRSTDAVVCARCRQQHVENGYSCFGLRVSVFLSVSQELWCIYGVAPMCRQMLEESCVCNGSAEAFVAGTRRGFGPALSL